MELLGGGDLDLGGARAELLFVTQPLCGCECAHATPELEQHLSRYLGELLLGNAQLELTDVTKLVAELLLRLRLRLGLGLGFRLGLWLGLGLRRRRLYRLRDVDEVLEIGRSGFALVREPGDVQRILVERIALALIRAAL